MAVFAFDLKPNPEQMLLSEFDLKHEIINTCLKLHFLILIKKSSTEFDLKTEH